MKLNLGSASRLLDGFINIDIELNSGTEQLDIRNPLPYNDVEIINIAQCLEHNNIFEAVIILQNCYRALKFGGKIRISVPDIDLILRYYYDNNLRYFSNVQPPLFYNVKSEMLRLSFLCLGNLSPDFNRNNYLGHQLLLNFDAVKELLEITGFKDIKQVEFNNFYEHEWGKDHSVYIEAIK